MENNLGFGTKCNVVGLPTMFVLDRTGKMVALALVTIPWTNLSRCCDGCWITEDDWTRLDGRMALAGCRPFLRYCTDRAGVLYRSERVADDGSRSLGTPR